MMNVFDRIRGQELTTTMSQLVSLYENVAENCKDMFRTKTSEKILILNQTSYFVALLMFYISSQKWREGNMKM
jgi:hypothetical protein